MAPRSSGSAKPGGAERALAVLTGREEAERYLSIAEPLRLGRAEVLAADGALGVLVRLARGGYFAAPFSGPAARELARLVPAGATVSLADDRYLAAFAGDAPVEADSYELWVFDGAVPPAVPDTGLSIALLGPGDADVVAGHYSLLAREAVEDHLARGWVRGGFDAAGALVGFIGEHDEASMGMLEVFPEARRRGFARALEAALIGELLEAGRVPYCHVAPGNEASRALQRKLGLRRVDTRQCWFCMPGPTVE